MRRILDCGLICLGLVALFACGPVSATEAQSRPNILFLLTDDQRWDMMNCAGNKIIRTPQMDTLAREGTRFRNAFVTTSICAASRASILTGLYERTHRFTFATPPIAGKYANLSYPALLKKAGYRTGFVGKFGVQVEKGTVERMFDSFVPLRPTPYLKKQPNGGIRHLTDITGDKAIDFLKSCKPRQPFCLSVSFNAPHAEDGDPRQYIWPKTEDSLYKNAVIPVPRTMNRKFFEKQPKFLRESESRVRFNWRFNEQEKYQAMVKGYYRMISGVDRVIGRLRKELDRLGFARNTVIIFSSDNGYFLGERGFADKWYIYEHSIRVPLIVADPRLGNKQRGQIVDAMALNVDIAPTMLDLAGVTVPKTCQGHSLLPWVRGQKPKNWRNDFFYEHLFERRNIPKSEGVRTARWTYVRWFEQKPVVEELYDHQADFEQTKNLVANPKYQKVLNKLRERTTALRDQYGGPYLARGKKKAK